MRKRILIFSFTYFPKLIGGAEIAVKEITDRSNSEYDFDMITIGDGGPSELKIGNVSVYRVGKLSATGKYLFIIQAFLKALSLNRKNKYDAIWSIMANYAGFSALFFKILNPKIPFILTLQEGDPIPHIKRRVRFFYPLFKMIFRRADIIQTISNYLADFAKSMKANCPIVIIPNGVDLDKFSVVDSIGIDEAKKFLGKKDNDFLLITTSRLVVKNGIKDIIDAVALLPENVRLIIAGTGPLENTLREQIKKLGLESRVNMIGFLSHEKMPNFLRASDVFIRPSLSEGLGNSFLEAMACGIPVIATRVGGIPDFLKDKKTGLFCEARNPQSIKEQVLVLMNDKTLRDNLIREALGMIKSKYSWKFISELMNNSVFKKVLYTGIMSTKI